MHACMHACMHAWMDGRTDGCIYAHAYMCKKHTCLFGIMLPQQELGVQQCKLSSARIKIPRVPFHFPLCFHEFRTFRHIQSALNP